METYSKRFVYLPEIDEKSWLLWTQREGSVCLRKFTDANGPCEYRKKFTELKAHHTAAVGRGDVYDLTGISNINVNAKPKFWFDFQQILNGCSGLVEVDHKALQAIFKEQFSSRVCDDSKWREIRALTHFWIAALACAEEKKVSDYDLKPMGEYPITHGKNWQAKMLDFSRKEGSCKFLDTPPYDTCSFSFAVTELGISVSSTKKILGMKARKLIQPDGLGIRKNGFLTVLEVKGPADDHELLPPVLQAACAATGILAKQDMLCSALRVGNGMRPKYENAKVKNERCIGIHVLTAKEKTERSKNQQLEAWSDKIEAQCKTLLRGFKELEYIAFSFVEPEKTKDFSVIKIDKLITPPEN